MFKKAIEFDPEHAPSYSGLSDLYRIYFYYHPEEKEKYFPLQAKYIKRAIDLDQNSAEVQYGYSFLFGVKGEREKRYETLKRVLNIDPNHWGANHQIGNFVRNIGLPYRSFSYMNKAIELDPLNTWSYTNRGGAYLRIGDFNKAAQDYESGLEIEPNDYWILYNFTYLLIMQKKPEEAKKLLRRLEYRYPDRSSVKYFKSLLMALKHDSVNAHRFFEESGHGIVHEIILYSILGKKDEALALMQEFQNEQEKEILSSEYLRYKHLPWYDNLREDIRFKAILSKEKERYEFLLNKYGNES